MTVLPWYELKQETFSLCNSPSKGVSVTVLSWDELKRGVDDIDRLADFEFQ